MKPSAVVSAVLLTALLLGIFIETSSSAKEEGLHSGQTKTESYVTSQHPQPNTFEVDATAGEFLLKVSFPGEHQLNRLLEVYNLRLVRSLLLPRYHLVRVTEDISSQTLGVLRSDPLVEFVEPNYVRRLDFLPDDPLYSYQWHLHQVQSGDAWDRADGTGVTVAVLDTGVAYEDYDDFAQAPDLLGTVFVEGYDFVNMDSHPNDDQGHGTHVTGTVAQTTSNGVGVAGLAFAASIMPVKVCGPGDDGCPVSSIIDGIVYAAINGARVISMSLGGPDYSQGELDAVNFAHEQGVVVVAAAGNDDTDEEHYPAAFDQVIAVGATDFRKWKAYYSNYGGWIDFVAPGGDVTADRNDDGYGDGVLQQTLNDAQSGDFSSFGFWFYQGTSMATPHVSALAALLFSVNPELTPDQVYSIIRDSALDLGATGKDDTFGWGFIQASDALDLALAPTQTPDLTLGDVWVDPPAPAEGDNVDLHATMQNIGSATAEAFTLGMYLDGALYATDEFTMGPLGESAVFVSWTATVGTHTVEWVIDLNDDVSELNEENNQASLIVEVAPEQRVIIVESYFSASRASVGTTQTVGFRAVWEDGVTPVSEGFLFVNDVPYTPDSDGWVWLQDSSEVVVRKVWSVTGVEADGVTDFQQVTPDVDVVWDRIRVVSLSVSDGRVDIASVHQVYVNAVYEYDGIQLTSGVVFLNGQPMSWDAEGSRWVMDVTNLEVGQSSYDVTGVIDYLYGLTEFTSPGEAVIVWDRLEVYGSGSTDERVDVGSFTTVWFRVRWAYDGTEFGAGQELFVDGAPASWSTERERWESTVSKLSVISVPFAVTGHTDNTFDITMMADLVGPETVVWDTIECYYLELGDGRVDVGASIEFRVRCRLSYDWHELGFGDSMSTDFASMTWDAGSSWFEVTKTQSTVGDYTFTVVSGYEATHGITALSVVAPNPRGVWDRIEVYYEVLDDERVDVGSEIEFRVKARLEYDDHQLESEDAITAGSGPLAWDVENSWFYGRRSQAEVGFHLFSVSSAYETTFGITVFSESVSHPLGVYDRVRLVTLGVHDTRIDVDTENLLYVMGELEYDGHGLSSGDNVVCNDLLMSWVPDEGLFEGRESRPKVEAKTYDSCEITEVTYGITVVDMNGQRATVIWDRVSIRLEGLRERINVGSAAEIGVEAIYEYDGMPFDGEVHLSNELTQNSVGSYDYIVDSVSGGSHGIRVFRSNNIVVLFDRIITEMDVDATIPGQARFRVKVTFAFDGSSVDDATVDISGAGAHHQGGGIYTVTLPNWWVTASGLVEVSRAGFSSATQEFSSLAVGNLGLYGIALVILGLLALSLIRRK